MKEFTTTNGQKRVIINCATMAEVIELKKEIFKQIKNTKIGSDLISGGADKDLLDKEINIGEVVNFLKDALISMDISPELESVIFKCLGHCTYDTVHIINMDLFDNICPDARQDYYEIIIACIEENLKPFMKSLVSAWSTIRPKLGNIQILNAIVH